MDWVVRFLLGLPPDEEGRAKAESLLRELDEHPSAARRAFPWGPFLLSPPGQFAEHLRNWLESPATSRRSTEASAARAVIRQCPLGHRCPLGSERISTGPSEEASTQHPVLGEPGTQDVPVEFLSVGGGVLKRGKNAFLEAVVREAHCRGQDLTSLIITDRYYHDSGGEDGSGDGFGVLEELLEKLGVWKSGHPFELVVSPSPEGTSSEKIKRLHERLRRARPSLTISHHKSVPFHDRVYLFRSRAVVNRSKISGVFGPSLNGVDGGLYIFGTLEGDALKAVAKVLDVS